MASKHAGDRPLAVTLADALGKNLLTTLHENLPGRTGGVVKITNPTFVWCPKQNILRFKLVAFVSLIINPTTSGWVNNKTHKRHQFESEDVLFWAPDERRIGNFNDASSAPGQIFMQGGQEIFSEGISKRHSEGAVTGMFGGHVEFMKFEWYKQELKRRPGRLWCVPNSKTGT